MKSFIEFRKELEKKRQERKNIPVLETQFGSHSLEKQKSPAMETQFGSHSVPKLDEDTETSTDIHHRSDDEHKRLHKSVMPIAKLTVKEMESVKEYTDESRPINAALHRHNQGYTLTDHDVINHIHNLSDAIDKASVTEDTHVYTGLPHSPGEHFTKIGEKQKVHLPAFTSTSTSMKTAREFSSSVSHRTDKIFGVDHGASQIGARHVLRIQLPKGTKAMSVQKHSFAKDEKEIILHRGHDIEIHPTVEVHRDASGIVTNIWHGKIVEHNPKKI